MYRKKVYGQSKETTCAFCGNIATTKTKEGVPCCRKHINSILEPITCVCGNILELKEGKYGPFFLCEKCGVMSFSKGMSLKNMKGFKLNKSFRNKTPENKSERKSVEKKKSIDDLWKEYYGL